jgi:hypothetical protein
MKKVSMISMFFQQSMIRANAVTGNDDTVLGFPQAGMEEKTYYGK